MGGLFSHKYFILVLDGENPNWFSLGTSAAMVVFRRIGDKLKRSERRRRQRHFTRVTASGANDNPLTFLSLGGISKVSSVFRQSRPASA